jgi:acyl-ACP thioesterase
VDNAPVESLPSAAAPPTFAVPPTDGRVFTVSYQVRSTDVTPGGRLRFDALARYLQCAAEDDLADAGWQEPYDWVVRRCAIAVGGYPRHGQRFRLATFCSATGPRWAERTTTLSTGAGDLLQATALWVAVARATGRPCELGPVFHRLYGPAAQGRRASARLSLPRPGPSLPARDWPLRASDFDPIGHVSNTVHWQAAEDILARVDWLPSRAEIEYYHPALPGDRVRLASTVAAGQALLWLLYGPTRLAAAQLSR